MTLLDSLSLDMPHTDSNLSDADTTKLLFNTANAVTAFSAIQALGFVFTVLGTPEITPIFRDTDALLVAAIGTIAFSFFYAYAVVQLSRRCANLDKMHQDLHLWLGRGRATAAALFGMVALAAIVFAHTTDVTTPQESNKRVEATDLIAIFFREVNPKASLIASAPHPSR